MREEILEYLKTQRVGVLEVEMREMKLLLTSAGITNKSIEKALFDLVDKKAEETSLLFIPTAANFEEGDKTWLIDDLVSLKKLGLKSIEIADIAALEIDIWKPRFESADILYFEGGIDSYLMKWINESGLIDILPEVLKDKVYVGVSAGSMVTCKSLLKDVSHILYDEDLGRNEDMPALGLVDFYFIPHLNSTYFTKVREELIRETLKGIDQRIYALDDSSAIKIEDGKIDVVSEGNWFQIN
jgi:dipeptidase E